MHFRSTYNDEVEALELRPPDLFSQVELDKYGPPARLVYRGGVVDLKIEMLSIITSFISLWVHHAAAGQVIISGLAIYTHIYVTHYEKNDVCKIKNEIA